MTTFITEQHLSASLADSYDVSRPEREHKMTPMMQQCRLGSLGNVRLVYRGGLGGRVATRILFLTAAGGKLTIETDTHSFANHVN